MKAKVIPSPDNLLRWLVGIATSVSVLLATWAGATIVDHTAKLAATEAIVAKIDKRMERMEDLLIQIMRDRKP